MNHSTYKIGRKTYARSILCPLFITPDLFTSGLCQTTAVASAVITLLYYRAS